MPGFIGLPEILLLGLVVLIIFGPKRLPEMGRSLGHGFREFKDSISGDKKDVDRFAVPTQEPEIAVLASSEEPPPPGTAAPAVATVSVERALSRVTREDERAA